MVSPAGYAGTICDSLDFSPVCPARHRRIHFFHACSVSFLVIYYPRKEGTGTEGRLLPDAIPEGAGITPVAGEAIPSDASNASVFKPAKAFKDHLKPQSPGCITAKII